MKRWWILAVLLAAALAYAAFSVVVGPSVEVATVLRRDVVQSVVASGRVAAPYRVDVGSQIVGTVAEVPVAEGQAVKAGQALRQAEANLANAQAQYDRNKRLYESGFVGKSVFDDPALTRLRGHSIGFVFQYHHLLPAFIALENVLMPMLVDRGRPDPAMRERAESLLASMQLTPWRDNLAINMSGGQQQRVAVARALAMNPSLLLADEPTGNLDTKSAQGVFDLMREVNSAHGTTVLVVTHNHPLAAQCGRIVQIVDGRVADGHAG